MSCHPTNLEDDSWNFNKTQTWHVVELFDFHELLEKTKHKEMLPKFSSFKNLLRMQIASNKTIWCAPQNFQFKVQNHNLKSWNICTLHNKWNGWTLEVASNLFAFLPWSITFENCNTGHSYITRSYYCYSLQVLHTHYSTPRTFNTTYCPTMTCELHKGENLNNHNINNKINSCIVHHSLLILASGWKCWEH